MAQKALRRVVDGVGEKQCTGTCQRWLAENSTNFYGRPGEFYAYCKECWKVYTAARANSTRMRAEHPAPTRAEGEAPDCTPAELAEFLERCRLVAAFDACHALDLLTCDWGGTTARTAQEAASL